jgi:hypothetical protein
MFFFEKKNQKTFICFGWRRAYPWAPVLRAMSKSFLLLFFKKEAFFTLLMPPSGQASCPLLMFMLTRAARPHR